MAAITVPYGAWYFPGWKDNPNHPFGSPWTKAWFWSSSYPERQPLQGWYDESKQEAMDRSISMAVAGGLDFFAFNWYYDSATKTSPGDHAITNFLASEVTGMTCAVGFESQTREVPVSCLQDWNDIVDRWARMFESPKYMRVKGRPVVFVVKVDHMHETVAKKAGVTHAQLLSIARQRSGENIYFVACGQALPYWTYQAELAGYDAYSTYNLSAVWTNKNTSPVPGPSPQSYADLDANYRSEWGWWVSKLKTSKLKFWVPITAGFDSRPWAGRCVGVGTCTELYAHADAAASVANLNTVLCEGVIAYAWNEWGEGGWLEPDLAAGRQKLGTLKSVFKPL